MNKLIERLINILIDRCGSYEWNGWERNAHHGGRLVGYTTYIKGYLITITRYDCEKGYYIGWYRDERWVRGFNEDIKKWIEIEVIDLVTRVGRRKTLGKQLFVLDNKDNQEIEVIFDEIQRVGKIFSPSKEDRATEENAVIRLCDDLSGVEPAKSVLLGA